MKKPKERLSKEFKRRLKRFGITEVHYRKASQQEKDNLKQTIELFGHY